MKVNKKQKYLNQNIANINPEKLPVLRHATLALDEAAQALNRMRSDSSPRDKK